MTIYDIPNIVALALPQAATPKNIISGFSSAGIWPFNRNIFDDYDFAPSDVTDRPNEIPTSQTPTASTSTTNHDDATPTGFSPELVRPFPRADLKTHQKEKQAKIDEAQQC